MSWHRHSRFHQYVRHAQNKDFKNPAASIFSSMIIISPASAEDIARPNPIFLADNRAWLSMTMFVRRDFQSWNDKSRTACHRLYVSLIRGLAIKLSPKITSIFFSRDRNMHLLFVTSIRFRHILWECSSQGRQRRLHHIAAAGLTARCHQWPPSRHGITVSLLDRILSVSPWLLLFQNISPSSASFAITLLQHKGSISENINHCNI